MLAFLARFGLSLLLAGAMVALAGALAYYFESPGKDLRAGIREALADAYGRAPGRSVDLGDIVDDDWEQLYVFAPLTPRDEIDRVIAPARLEDDRDLVPPDRSMVVLTEGSDVVAAETVGRSPIDISCATGGANHALTRSAEPRVVRTVVAGTPRLAVTETGEPEARKCLERLPP